MEDKIEFIVTLKNRDDLEKFYRDMEHRDCENYCVPSREVVPCIKRPISRNTHYYLTEDEAKLLRNDPRVLDVMPAKIILDSIAPLWTQNSIWDKSESVSSSYKNWALKRCVTNQNEENWGSEDGKNSQITATSEIDLNGRDIDVIIIDGHFDPTHPEFAVDPSGTGGTRVNQYNWFQLNDLVSSIDDDGYDVISSDQYLYEPYLDISNVQRTLDNNHGCHVAGIAAGNTHGWARKSTIYNINPYPSNINGTIFPLLLWDYIRAFHLTKQINSTIGRKNPTVCNCSFGSTINFPNTGGYITGNITLASYRGAVISDPNGLTYQQLIDSKIYKNPESDYVKVPLFSAAISADIEDAISDGIIVVGAAGNSSFRVVKDSDQDYNNYFYATYDGINYMWYFHRGTTPSAVSGVMCVGSSSSLSTDQKSDSSECGNRIDIFAPGENIMSSVNTLTYVTGTNDPRNSNYKISKYNGTSMASPQVAGLIACILERYPNLGQEEINSLIKNSSKNTILNNQSDDAADTSSLQGAENRMLYYKNERKLRGKIAYPANNRRQRDETGVSYPRNI